MFLTGFKQKLANHKLTKRDQLFNLVLSGAFNRVDMGIIKGAVLEDAVVNNGALHLALRSNVHGEIKSFSRSISFDSIRVTRQYETKWTLGTTSGTILSFYRQ